MAHQLNSDPPFDFRLSHSSRQRAALRLNLRRGSSFLAPFYRRLEIRKSLKRWRLARLLIAVPSINF
jgi:hypothetical protein